MTDMMLRDTCFCGEPATIPPDYCADCYKAHGDGFKEMAAFVALENEAIEILNVREIRRVVAEAAPDA